MQSRTLFFNRMLFKKTVTRFWPIWLIYFAAWLLILPVGLGSTLRYTDDLLRVQNYVLNSATTTSIAINAVFAVFSAMAVFSFMYSARSAHGTASLPIRREGVFLSVTLAGFLPLVSANVLVFLITLATELFHGMLDLRSALEWLGSVTLMLTFYYSFSVFCAQLTGNVLVLPFVYVVLNFTVVVVEAIVRILADNFVYGLSDHGGFTLLYLSPPAGMLDSCMTRRIQDANYNLLGYTFEGWGILLLYAIAGLLLLTLALFLYRSRRMESAGDVVAVRILKPVFKYCLTGGCALVLGWFLYSVFTQFNGWDPGLSSVLQILLYMLIGALIGYFAAEMLIQKSFRVWRKQWRGFAISVAVIIVCVLGLEFDLLGIERRVPDADDVESVLIRSSSSSIHYEDPAMIEDIIEMHEYIIDHKDAYETMHLNNRYSSTHRSNYLYLDYNLGNRQMLSREYELPYTEGIAESYGVVLSLQDLINTTDAILQRNNTRFEYTEKNITGMTVEAVLPGKLCAELAGYDSVEEYVLCEYGDLTPDDIQSMSDENRYQFAQQYAHKHAYFIPDTIAEEWDYIPEFSYEEAKKLYPSSSVVEITETALEDICFQYTWQFTAEEAVDMYFNCILPDMQDKTIGLDWLIHDEEYESSVYSAKVTVVAREIRSDISGDYSYDNFDITPTTISTRTLNWLQNHGVVMQTVQQTSVDPH